MPVAAIDGGEVGPEARGVDPPVVHGPVEVGRPAGATDPLVDPGGSAAGDDDKVHQAQLETGPLVAILDGKLPT
eukprot:6824938-Pyramimonas_sp.AAC.1